MLEYQVAKSGDFTLFGYIKKSRSFLEHYLTDRLNITPRIIDIDQDGCFFYYTSYGDVAESKEAIVLKTGFARSTAMITLSSDDMWKNGIVKPDKILANQISGNTTVLCLSKQKPIFSAYQTLMSVFQLYYTAVPDGIVCSDSLRVLHGLLNKFELNEKAIPFHFLFRVEPGHLTFFENIYRLHPGELLTWSDGKLQIKLERKLEKASGFEGLHKPKGNPSLILFEYLKHILRLYTQMIAKEGADSANLLSGGVDSSVTQVLLNEILSPAESPRSFSFAMLTPGYSSEIAYADLARRSLQTDHTVIELSADNYLDLLVRVIKTICHPCIYVESAPCFLGLAEYLKAKEPGKKYFFCSQGADTLFGINMARKLFLLTLCQRIPGSTVFLRLLSNLLRPFSHQKAASLHEVKEMLISVNTPSSFYYPLNMITIWTDIETARRTFGDQAILDALEYRRDFTAQYLDNKNCIEQVQTLDYITASYEVGVFMNQLFLSCNKKILCHFFDQDIIEFAYNAFGPVTRYIRNGNPKYLLKQVLVKKSLKTIARQSKRGGLFEQDLFSWMQNGILRDRVHSINRPGFLSQQDFQWHLEHPSRFLWNLLTFDIFKEEIIKNQT